MAVAPVQQLQQETPQHRVATAQEQQRQQSGNDGCGVSGAPTGTVGGAAVGSGSIENVVALYRNLRFTRGVLRPSLSGFPAK